MFSLAAPPTLPRPYEAASFAEHFSQIPFCHAITVKPVFYCIWNRSHMVVLSMFSMNKQNKRKLDVCILCSSLPKSMGKIKYHHFKTSIESNSDADAVIHLIPISLS